MLDIEQMESKFRSIASTDEFQQLQGLNKWSLVRLPYNCIKLGCRKWDSVSSMGSPTKGKGYKSAGDTNHSTCKVLSYFRDLIFNNDIRAYPRRRIYLPDYL